MRKAPSVIEFVYPMPWALREEPRCANMNEGSRKWVRELGFIRDEERADLATCSTLQ